MARYLIVIATILLIGVTAAWAQPCNFTASSGDWDLLTNWSCGHVPTPDDRAVILNGNTCTMNDDDGRADNLTVEINATLNIEAGKKLTLDGSVSLTSTIDGTLNITASGADIGELAIVDNDQTIDGGGKIVGQDNAAKITIALLTTLTIEGTVEGKLVIDGLGTLKNAGKIHANASGTLHVNTRFVEDTVGTDRWKVSTLNVSILRFDPTDSTRPDLAGDFTVVQGKLDIDGVGFGTTGKLTMTGGILIFDVEGSPDVVVFSSAGA